MRWMRPPEGCESESTLKPTSPGPDSQRKTLPFHCPLAERERERREGGKKDRKKERKEGGKKEREEEREKGKADQLLSVVWLNKC